MSPARRGTVTRVPVVPIILALGLLAIAAARPVFLSPASIVSILVQGSVLAIVAIGTTPLMVGGHIDLSVGSVLALAGVVLAQAIGAGCSAALATVIAISVGLGCGLVNGAVTALLRMPSFIVTLGMMGIARGLALAFSGGRPISEVGDVARYLGTADALKTPMPLVVVCVVGLLLYIALHSTVWGTHVKAFGGSPRAAWLAGITPKWMIMSTCAVSGVAAALAGVVLAGRLGSAQPIVGSGYELDAITAVVLGGGSLQGGRGTVVGTLTAVMLLSAARAALVMLDVEPYYHQVLTGVVLIIAIAVDPRRRSRAET